MVRLKHSDIVDELEGFNAFQSHNGSIKTSDKSKNCVVCSVFQSHNGSIKTRRRKNQRRTQVLISIPQWFD